MKNRPSRKHKVLPKREYFDEAYDTPTLIEVWRTAPYMNDGNFTEVKALLVEGKHGSSGGGVEKLTAREIDDLVKFVLSL